jgi:hypothetical protein
MDGPRTAVRDSALLGPLRCSANRHARDSMRMMRRSLKLGMRKFPGGDIDLCGRLWAIKPRNKDPAGALQRIAKPDCRLSKAARAR